MIVGERREKREGHVSMIESVIEKTSRRALLGLKSTIGRVYHLSYRP